MRCHEEVFLCEEIRLETKYSLNNLENLSHWDSNENVKKCCCNTEFLNCFLLRSFIGSYQINNEVFVLEETFFLHLFFSFNCKAYRLGHFLNAKDKAAQNCQLNMSLVFV